MPLQPILPDNAESASTPSPPLPPTSSQSWVDGCELRSFHDHSSCPTSPTPHKKCLHVFKLPKTLNSGHEQVAEVLLQAGAKWTILTKRLQTPYDLAVSRGLKIQALRIQDVRN